MTDHETPEKRETTTPETDADVYGVATFCFGDDREYVMKRYWDSLAAHARRLESERNEARERVDALEDIAGQAMRYIDTLCRPNETTQAQSSAHFWARGIEIEGRLRALLTPQGASNGHE